MDTVIIRFVDVSTQNCGLPYIVVIIESHLLKSVNTFWTPSNLHVFLYCSSLDDVVAVEAE